MQFLFLNKRVCFMQFQEIMLGMIVVSIQFYFPGSLLMTTIPEDCKENSFS